MKNGFSFNGSKVAARLFVVILLFSLYPERGAGQSIPVGTRGFGEYYRNLQLTGGLDSSISFTVRPVLAVGNTLAELPPDSTESGSRYWRVTSMLKFGQDKGLVRLLPVSWQSQYNTDHPYGWNDGPVIPAKGFQTVLSAGIYAEYGPVSVQLQPEFVTAANRRFESILENHYATIAARYYDHYIYMDLPERFGEETYSRTFWGQSSIRLNLEPVSFGVSTESLWWGPGVRNSLVMSNNAPGFLHFTVNTTKPVKTPIGSFEGQLVGGRLDSSGFNPTVKKLSYFGLPLGAPKPDDWRYLSGMVLTYQPKWVDGLFLGIARSSQKYSKDLKGLADYLPLFRSFKKMEADNIDKADSYSSLFFRWFWKEEQAEAYFEYGTNQQNRSFRDFLLEPGDSRAFIFGLRKSFPLRNRDREYLQVNFELTELQQNSFENIQNFESWYQNRYVKHGYTNHGQVLGAGIGPGSNLQSLEVSWLNGIRRVGLQFERYLHNNDFYYYAYEDSRDLRRHWYDLSIGLDGQWGYKNLIFNAQAKAIKSYNYGWYLDPANEVPGVYFIDGLTAFNMHFQLGATYRF